MKKLRILHRYMGLLFSPAILFFAFSGALQTFDLHSTNKSTGYVPPLWLVEMAQLHKKQTLTLNKAKSKPAQADQGSSDPGSQKKDVAAKKSPLPLKCFVVVMSVGLMATTLLGIYMAFRFGGDGRLVWGMLAIGTLLPIAMMFL
ncbi:PepSY domain-containing protein [Acidicapsa dinghuensis]|uniref:PepSY domain-containing protein n=1 Tax=Acidicapsa dinghuensis TaxID=2218256 RepID=A0ABW1EBU8_9BACT|nr:PepSY domain-containing protein [Acidicapsa dinghuensis]